MDPSLESVEVEAFFTQQDPQWNSVHKPFVQFILVSCLRQAKEKSKGTWVEKALDEWEEIYKTEEQREWLKTMVVNSRIPSILRQDTKSIVAISADIIYLSLSLFWFDINIYQISCPCCYNSFLRTSWASTSTSRSLKESLDFGNYFIFWNSSGCPKDPENPRKRLYKIFEGNKHSSLGPKITLFRTIISVFEARVPLRWAISCEPRRVFQRTKRCARRWLIALLEQKLILRVLPTNSLRRMLERIRGWSQSPSQNQRRQSYVWCGYVIGFKHVQTRCSGIG